MEPYANIAGIQIGDHYPVRLMGIINISPESFFKGSVFSSREDLKRVAEQMAASGADILDVGARGTAPYLQTDISVEEEMDRLAQAIHTIKEVTDTPISADTQTAAIAKEALNAGASILNDVSGLAHDPDMAKIAKEYKGVILMANASYTDTLGDPVSVVKTSLEAALQRAELAEIAPENIVLDPGIGFFRNRNISWDEWDRIILQQLPALRSFERPLMLSVSRKSFIGRVLEYSNPADRLYGSLGLTSLVIHQGAHLIRTHDVAATRDVVRITEWLREPAT
ncbi:dihydropteroate synthase [Ktedonosporobacter rubrisoli]|uniref:dihydropteroate synthase n=1 Tax=Ktedonosporobacter rubrisoli TaxID=2509675 RepID=A0A4P6JMW5_KTERU|nr:dihydropteroate synthase [Ktedonosporobacter rubrisoli]QBD76410.1 dihydropteroate synthase [Ktedonosporobacter rubrisoli]